MNLGRFRIFLIFITLGVAGFCAIQFQKFALQHNPESLILNVTFSWPGTPASIIEDEVTLKLEGLFSAIAGVSKINSISQRGRGKIEIEFKNAEEFNEKRLEIVSIIRRIHAGLPHGVTYPMLSANLGHTANSLIYKFSVYSSDESASIRDYVDETIIPLVSRIDGVGKVQASGGDVFQWRISLNSERMDVFKIRAKKVFELIRNSTSSSFFGNGLSEPGHNSLNVVLTTYVNDVSMLRQLPIKLLSGKVIKLVDIAEIELVKQLPNSYSRINGFNAIDLQVFSDPDVNVLATTHSIDRLLESISKQLPRDYKLKTTIDSSEDLVIMISRIIWEGLCFALLLLLLSLLIFRSFKATTIILLCLIINVLLFSLTYHLIGIQMNFDSLMCILVSLGIIMGIQSLLLHQWIAGNFAFGISSAFRISFLIVIALCLLLFLPAIQYSPISDLAMFLSLNIAISFLVSWLFLPNIASYLYNLKGFSHSPFISGIPKYVRIYVSSIIFIRRYRVIYFCLVVVLIGFPYDLIFKNDNQPLGFLPQDLQKTVKKLTGGSVTLFTENVFHNEASADFSKTALVISGIMSQENSIDQLNDIIIRIEKFISTFDEVDYFQTTVSGPVFSEVKIYFKKAHELNSFPQFFKGEIEAATTRLGGVSWIVYGVGEGFSNSSVTASTETIVLQGFNRTVLHEKAEQLASILSDNKRVTDLVILDGEDRYTMTEYQYVLKFNPYYLAERDFTVTDVFAELSNKNFNQAFGPILLNESATQLWVKTESVTPFSLWDLTNLPLEKDGSKMKLGESASLKKVKIGDRIVRNNQQYTVSVSYNFIGPPFMQKKFNSKVVDNYRATMPVGYKIKEQDDAGQWDKKSDVQYYFIIYIAILLVLMSSIYYESFTIGLYFVVLLPIVFVGVLLASYLSDNNFDMGVVAGFYMTEIIAVCTAVHFMDCYRDSQKHEKSWRIKISVQGLVILCMPVFIVFFILMFHKQAFWQNLSIAIIGGLSAILLSTPIVLPIGLRVFKRVFN